jgi:hypothetical protein
MKIIYNNIIPFQGYKCINLFGILFCRKNAKIDDKTIEHESIHSNQMKYMIWVFFYLWYVIEWFIKVFKYKNFHTAYRNISFEREAYKFEYVTGYHNEMTPYSWFKYLVI